MLNELLSFCRQYHVYWCDDTWKTGTWKTAQIKFRKILFYCRIIILHDVLGFLGNGSVQNIVKVLMKFTHQTRPCYNAIKVIKIDSFSGPFVFKVFSFLTTRAQLVHRKAFSSSKTNKPFNIVTSSSWNKIQNCLLYYYYVQWKHFSFKYLYPQWKDIIIYNLLISGNLCPPKMRIFIQRKSHGSFWLKLENTFLNRFAYKYKSENEEETGLSLSLWHFQRYKESVRTSYTHAYNQEG